MKRSNPALGGRGSSASAPSASRHMVSARSIMVAISFRACWRGLPIWRVMSSATWSAMARNAGTIWPDGAHALGHRRPAPVPLGRPGAGDDCLQLGGARVGDLAERRLGGGIDQRVACRHGRELSAVRWVTTRPSRPRRRLLGRPLLLRCSTACRAAGGEPRRKRARAKVRHGLAHERRGVSARPGRARSGRAGGGGRNGSPPAAQERHAPHRLRDRPDRREPAPAAGPRQRIRPPDRRGRHGPNARA